MSDNQYEVAARLRKVSAMVTVIDRAAVEKGIHEADRILDAFTRWTDKDWARVDRLAQLKTKSSKTTRELVVEEYKKRAELPF